MTDEQAAANSQSTDGIIGHVPVLADDIESYLLENNPKIIVDCTLGRGGHAERILTESATVRVIGLDVDDGNLSFASNRLASFGDRFTARQANFVEIAKVLADLGIPPVDGILADLGISSNQLDDPMRGLSFDADGPLDMRLDPRQKTTAADLINTMSEGEISDMLWLNAQERQSRRIAKRICQVRHQGRINSTVLLARLVAAATGQHAGRQKIHPATRTFMALRMAVNRELASLTQLLQIAPDCLSPGGRIAIISFHSGEDRIVKERFRDEAAAGRYRILTKKPIVSDEAERIGNPRSRSAKLRVAERAADA